MRKAIIAFFVLVTCNVFSQEKLFKQLTDQIKKEYPGIKLENKLVVLNVWSAGDSESREKNKQADKAYDVYEFARLKGGLKGMVAVVICKDKTPGGDIVLKKDNIKKALVLDATPEMDLTGIANIVFDSNGNIVKTNISTDLFKELNQLITR